MPRVDVRNIRTDGPLIHRRTRSPRDRAGAAA